VKAALRLWIAASNPQPQRGFLFLSVSSGEDLLALGMANAGEY